MQLREQFRTALEWLKGFRPKRTADTKPYRRRSTDVRVVGGTEAIHDGRLFNYRRWTALD